MSLKSTLKYIFALGAIFLLTACSAPNSGNTNIGQSSVQPADQAARENQAAQSGEPASASSTPAGNKTFTHPGYGFSFNYPSDWNATSFTEGDGETVLVQKSVSVTPPSQGGEKEGVKPPSQGGEKEGVAGVQIYISLFDEQETVLTKERILQDIPDLKITNDKPIKFAGTLDALSFDSVNDAGLNTKEIWFVHNGFLYQISAITGSETILNKMIGTWKFN